jgi:fido (protein-threonine AMPylation protein)
MIWTRQSMATLPRSEEELQRLEAKGLWRAQIYAKRFAEGTEKISLKVLLDIHKTFQIEANPHIAGRFRKMGEDIKKLACMTPPLGIAVQQEMYTFWSEFDRRIATTPSITKGKKIISKTTRRRQNELVINLAAWTQYQIARIHPFCEGNGRMARLMTNVLLRRFNLLPSDIKYEGENKQKYLQALCQIDYKEDYRMLIQLIIKGMTTSYKKLIDLKKKVHH